MPIDIQVKSTHESNIEITSDYIKFDFEVKNYNDFISRRLQPKSIPLILILFIFPNDNKNWIIIDENELKSIHSKRKGN